MSCSTSPWDMCFARCEYELSMDASSRWACARQCWGRRRGRQAVRAPRVRASRCSKLSRASRLKFPRIAAGTARLLKSAPRRRGGGARNARGPGPACRAARRAAGNNSASTKVWQFTHAGFSRNVSCHSSHPSSYWRPSFQADSAGLGITGLNLGQMQSAVQKSERLVS